MVEIIQKIGAYACGILVFWSALRAVIKLRINLIFTDFSGCTPAAYLDWESPDGEKFFKIYTKSNRI